MNFNYGSLLSIEDILSDVSVAINDEEFRQLNIGFYRRQVKEALRKLQYNTHFDERTQDVDMPENLMLQFPVGGFNLKDIFLFNTPNNITDGEATSSDCCAVNQMVRVFHKSKFISRGKNMGYTARTKPLTQDPFYYSHVADDLVYFYNIQNGMIMLSESCATFNKIRLVYDGDAADIDKSKIIPPLAREGIVAFVTERALFHLKVRNPQLRAAWVDAKNDMVDRWRDAEYYMKRMDKKQRDDLAEYLSRLQY